MDLPSTSPVERLANPEPRMLGAGFDFTNPLSPLAPFYLRASQVTAVAFLCAIFVLLNFAPLWHTDIWGHLKFGQWIVANRRLPERDPFCPFAEVSAGYIHYCWLGQVSLYLLYHLGELLAGGGALERMAGGVALLRFAHAVLVVARGALLLAAFRRVSRSRALAAAALVLGFALSLGSLAVLRPQVQGELGFACLLLALSRPCLSRRALIFIPLLLALWSNLHGSYPAGLLLLAGAAAGRGIELLLESSGLNLRALRGDLAFIRLSLALAFAVLTVAVFNPSGPRIYLETLQMARHPNVQAMDEWQPLGWPPGAPLWTFLATLALLAMTWVYSRKNPSATTLILIVVFAGQSLLHQRMLVWWIMLVPWMLVRSWPACVRRWQGSRRAWQSVPSFRKTLLAALLVLFAVLWSNPVQWLVAGEPAAVEQALSGGTPWRLTYQLAQGNKADARGLPELQKTLANYPGGRFTGCVFASETLGDLFLWDLAPEVPVFVYSHVHLFSPEHWGRCQAVRWGTRAALPILDLYHANLVVVEPDFNQRLCALLRKDQGWEVIVDEPEDAVKRDPRQRLFVAVRKKPK